MRVRLLSCTVYVLLVEPATSLSSEEAYQVCHNSWSAISLQQRRASFGKRELISRVPPTSPSGISDHMTGMLSAFALSLATGRSFRIDWPALRETFDCPRPGLGRGIFLNDTERVALTRRVAQAQVTNEVLSPSADPSFGNPAQPDGFQFFDWHPRGADQVGDELQLSSSLNSTFSGSSVVVQGRHGVLDRAFAELSELLSKKKGKTAKSKLQRQLLGGALANLGLTQRNAFGCLYHYLLVPKIELLEPYQLALRKINASKVSIALHIRTGDEAIARIAPDGSLRPSRLAEKLLDGPMYDGYTGARNLAPARSFPECAQTLESLMWKAVKDGSLVTGDHGRQKGDIVWFVASDSAAMARAVVGEFDGGSIVNDNDDAWISRSVVPSPETEPLHSASWVHWKAQHNVGMAKNEAKLPRADVEAFESGITRALLRAATGALLDQYVLGECDAHVLSPFSGFSRVGHAIALGRSSSRRGDSSGLYSADVGSDKSFEHLGESYGPEERLQPIGAVVIPDTGACIKWDFYQVSRLGAMI